MFGLRLKFNMAVYIALLLMVAMVLIGLVTVISARNQLVRAQTDQGHLLVAAIDACVDLAPVGDDFLFNQDFIGHVRDILNRSGFSCLLVTDRSGRRLNLGLPDCTRRLGMHKTVDRVMDERSTMARLIGSTWGVLWKQPGYLMIAEPVVRNGKLVGGIGVAGGLDGIYRQLRQRQPYLMGYLLVNTIFLTLIGLYKLSRLTVTPLQGLVKRAENLQGQEETFFLPDQRADEFNRLSVALNRMLERIQDDRRTLRQTVTSLEKANQDLRQMQKEVVRAEKLATAGRLSAGIAHEIGNPIGIAMGYMELLKQEDLPADDRTDCIRKTGAELARIDTIIRQLLDFSRPAADAAIEPIAVHDVVREIADVFRMQPLTSDIQLQLELKAPRDIVRADASQLRQIFLNLMINAADAIGSARQTGGCLKVKSCVVENQWDKGAQPSVMLELQFIDNGIGIAPEYLDSIFDPFFTTKAPGQGTGLGLSVSIMLVENMGGRMAVNSRPGMETVMRVFLPLALETAGHVRPSIEDEYDTEDQG